MFISCLTWAKEKQYQYTTCTTIEATKETQPDTPEEKPIPQEAIEFLRLFKVVQERWHKQPTPVAANDETTVKEQTNFVTEAYLDLVASTTIFKYMCSGGSYLRKDSAKGQPVQELLQVKAPLMDKAVL